MNSPLILVVLDGWGHAKDSANNSITQANTPNWDKLWQMHPHGLISSSGLDVGLPDGQMGNSEVGHMTMGAGRVIHQDLSLINQAIESGDFAKNPMLRQALDTDKTIHIIGLLSDGGVHSHQDQIFALLDLAKDKKIVVHPFLDGRDVPPKSAEQYLEKLNSYNVDVADIMGRFYAMDRDNRVERTTAAIELLTTGKSIYTAKDSLEALSMAYERGEKDEFVAPTKITSSVIKNGDTVIFMNFRTDRARQLSHALKQAVDINLYTLTEYDTKLDATVIFPKEKIHNTFGQIISEKNISQLHIAETEKYAHVTFFFNCGREEPYIKEDRILIPSVKCETYDSMPLMSAFEITDAIVNAIAKKTHEVIICNFANADMVGHTGNLKAACAAVECLDNCLGKIAAAIEENGGQVIITADHGNCEEMWNDETGQAHTAHTGNLVPVVYLGKEDVKFLDGNFGLQDIAPTMLSLLKLPIPKDMTGTPMFA